MNMKLPMTALALALMAGVTSCEQTAEAEREHAEASHEEEGEHGEERARVTITAAAAQASGVVVATAGPGAIRDTLSLTGRIMLQPSARAEIHAPYPGPVRSVTRNIGDIVRRGETLARVESAESLQTYSVPSPIAGVVLERATNVGDVTGDDPLFIVGDLSRLQAELNIATRDIGRVAPGQTVVLSGLDGARHTEVQIASVLPTADARSQTLIARAPITVAAGSPMRPGMAVRGAVVLTEQQAPIVVPRDAVQTLEGRSVVFVRVSADTYEARPVTIGRTGRDAVEITGGLTAGQAYVSQNAFLVKAELLSGTASHDH